MSKTLLSCVIPCYDSAETIEDGVREIDQTIAPRSQEYDYEVILVNDGSPDNGATIAKLRLVAAEYGKIGRASCRERV